MRLGAVSCLKIHNQKDQDEVWNDFNRRNCEAIIVHGDCFYMKKSWWRKLAGRSHFNEEDMRSKAFDQWNYFSSMKPKSLTDLFSKLGNDKFLTTWDDHDHQGNNKGGAYNKRTLKDRAVAKKVFLDTFPWIPASRSDDYGVEYSQVFAKDKVAVIMLDTRYYRSKKELIGCTQWTWLEATLEAYKDHQVVLVSSSTLNGKDGWKQYPSERKKLLSLLCDKQALPLILSGDVHSNKVSRWSGITGERLRDDDIAKTEIVTELTTSGVRDGKYNRAIIDITRGFGNITVEYELKGKNNKIDFKNRIMKRYV